MSENMYGWNGKSKKMEPESIVNDCAKYSIGSYDVYVGQDGSVTTERKYRQFGHPQQTLPNLEVVDGEIRLPITDLVGEILSRLEPADLAAQLWSDEGVRTLFLKTIARRWGDDWTDGDRRKLLHDLKEAVHDQVLDTLANSLSSMEWHNSQSYFHRSHTGNVNAWLSDRGLDLRIPYETESPDFKVGGKSWNEARDYWRETVRASFPAPVEPVLEDEDIAL